MTTAERREAILAQLGRKPIAARTLAAKYGVSRQVIVQDLAVLRAAHPNVISTARGYVRQQAESACTREFKVRHTPAQTGLELNLIVDCGGRVCSTSISHRVYGRCLTSSRAASSVGACAVTLGKSGTWAVQPSAESVQSTG